MAENSASAQPLSGIGRHRDRRTTLVTLLACLGAVSFVVFIVQSPSLFRQPSFRFVGQVAFSADGTRLAWTSEGTDEGRVVLWDLQQHRQRGIIGPRDSEPDLGAVSTYTSLAFSPDCRTIATGTRSTPAPDPRVILWDCESGCCTQVLRGHSDAVIALAFSPDGKTLASASSDRTVKLWDIVSPQPRASLAVGNTPVTSIAFSPDGRLIATGWADRLIRLWNVETGLLAMSLSGHTKAITCVAVSPDGRTLASASFDGSLRLWDLGTGRLRTSATGFPNACRSIVFSPNGRVLALKFAETSNGGLWDLDLGRMTATIPNATAGLAYSHDGGMLAVAGGALGRVFLVDVAKQSMSGPLRTSPN
jgi:WD40 repeat protein